MVKQGDIILIELGSIRGSEYGKNRPAVVVQEDMYNDYFETIIVALITGKVIPEYTTNIFLSKKESGLKRDSMILTNQLRTIDKSRINDIISSASPSTINKIKLSLKRVFGM
jgi:mRNA interferase MazF